MQLAFWKSPNIWIRTKDGDSCAKAIFDRHYSKYHYKDGRDPALFAGPGEKLVLVLVDYSALFVWRKFQSDDGQNGINCSVFRNESEVLSSWLIREAEEWAWHKWPGERLYTYIAPKKIKSTNPGYCYLKAGWNKCGITKVHKHIIMEKLPL